MNGTTSRRRWRMAVMATGLAAAIGVGALAAVAAGGANKKACDLVARGSMERELHGRVQKKDGQTICTYIAEDLVSGVSVSYPEVSVQTDDLGAAMSAYAEATQGSARTLAPMKAAGSSYPAVVVSSDSTRTVQLSMLVGDRMVILTAMNLGTGQPAQIAMLQRLASEALASL